LKKPNLSLKVCCYDKANELTKVCCVEKRSYLRKGGWARRASQGSGRSGNKKKRGYKIPKGKKTFHLRPGKDNPAKVKIRGGKETDLA